METDDASRPAHKNLAAALLAPETTEELDLGGALLRAFPREILTLTRLKRLRAKWLLAWGADPTIPAELGNLAALEELDLCFLQAHALPDELGALRALRHLDLRQSTIGRLPSTLGQLECLEFLDLISTPVEELPESVGALGHLHTIRASSLRRIPASLWSVKSLRVLWLTKELDEPPAGLGALTALEELTLPLPTLVRYAAELPGLRSLRRLRVWWPDDMQYGRALPDEVGQLASLTELDVSVAHVRDLPGSLSKLQNLEVLDVRSNALTRLEWLVRALPRLRRVRFGENKLATKEKIVIEELLRLPPEARATAVIVPVKRPKPDVKALGDVVGINASVAVVLGDAEVARAWRGVTEQGPAETDWDRLHRAHFPTNAPETWKASAALEVGAGRVVGLSLWDEGSGFSHVFRSGEALVIAEGAIDDKKDTLFLEWIASAPDPSAVEVGEVVIVSGWMVALNGLEDGAAVAKASKKPPAPGKGKSFGAETRSVLFATPPGTYRVLLEDKVERSWGRARRCLVQPG